MDDPYAFVLDPRMKRGLEDGKVIDVSGFSLDLSGGYILPAFAEGLEYCDAAHQKWMDVVVRQRETGRIVAAQVDLFDKNVWEVLHRRKL